MLFYDYFSFDILEVKLIFTYPQDCLLVIAFPYFELFHFCVCNCKLTLPSVWMNVYAKWFVKDVACEDHYTISGGKGFRSTLPVCKVQFYLYSVDNKILSQDAVQNPVWNLQGKHEAFVCSEITVICTLVCRQCQKKIKHIWTRCVHSCVVGCDDCPQSQVQRNQSLFLSGAASGFNVRSNTKRLKS